MLLRLPPKRRVIDVSEALVPFAKYNGPDKVAAWSRDVADRVHAINLDVTDRAAMEKAAVCRAPPMKTGIGL